MRKDKRDFVNKVYSVKKRLLAMYKEANAGHIACSLSCAEILTFLTFFWMDDPDTLILSKGHAAAALYAVLCEAGLITEDDIKTFYKEGTYLGAHPPVRKIRGIPFATGSLGHGLPISAGRAFASKLKKENRLFFCVTSDGELDEGSTWEAALFISHHRLTNLIWMIDRNHIQGFGRTEDVMALEPLDVKLKAFRFHVIKADGHSYDSLLAAKLECLSNNGTSETPNVIICETIKGHGVSFMENTVDWHYLPMDDGQYKKALDELDAWREQQ
ncbi:MAG: transketolase [Clostridiales bacterium]|nr:transketolase [Clostridiales bacterium]